MSQLELAGPLLPRLVGPHEFQRHPLPRPCLAVEDDQGAGGSLAAKVDGLRQLGLAHLLLPSQQDGALSPGRLAGVAQQFAHGARLPHQGGELGHRLAQLMNGAQSIGGMEQDDEADPVRPREGLEAHHGVDEGLAPGLPPLQRHLHMAQGSHLRDGQTQALGQQQMVIEGLAQAESRVELQPTGRQGVEVAQPPLGIPGQHAVFHAIQQGIELAQMVLGLLHQALHLQQIGQLTAGADGEREIPRCCLFHPADQGHDRHLATGAVVDRAGTAVPGVETLVEVLGAADAERHPLQGRQVDGIGADASLAEKRAWAKTECRQRLQGIGVAGPGQQATALVGEQQGAGAPLHELVEILQRHLAGGEQVPLALAQALQGLPSGAVGRMPEGRAGLVGTAQPGGLQVLGPGREGLGNGWHGHGDIRQKGRGHLITLAAPIQ